MKKVSEAEMLHKMAAYCSVAERCIQEIEKKMAGTDLPDDAKKRIIDRLVKEKYIDEERFVRFFINDKLQFNKWGRIKLSYELQKKGIPASIRTEGLDTIDEEMYEDILYNLLKSKKKVTKGKDSRDIYYKLMRFAAGRGFESHKIQSNLKRILNDSDYEEYTD